MIILKIFYCYLVVMETDENKKIEKLSKIFGIAFTSFYLYATVGLAMAGYNILRYGLQGFPNEKVIGLTSVGITLTVFTVSTVLTWVFFSKKKFHLSMFFSFFPALLGMTFECISWAVLSFLNYFYGLH